MLNRSAAAHKGLKGYIHLGAQISYPKCDSVFRGLGNKSVLNERGALKVLKMSVKVFIRGRFVSLFCWTKTMFLITRLKLNNLMRPTKGKL